MPPRIGIVDTPPALWGDDPEQATPPSVQPCGTGEVSWLPSTCWIESRPSAWAGRQTAQSRAAGSVFRLRRVAIPIGWRTNHPQDATAAYEGDSRFDALRFVIADYTAITGCNAKPSDIEMVGAMGFGARRSNHRIRKAVVTTSPDVMAMAEHCRIALGSPVPTQTFATMAEARAWLARAEPGWR